ncbi:hypothetical protein AZH53_08410 [Methanomicrobiaceae archaeon CYW5]|uniref:hypothetical protein n=1 Tax=Methanovulcanius yangii TaxID=1789227 RepID=UPI0029C9CEEB|nr:hypothetical protein [Methanovulcanius yangii]MBT8508425.1 hypothetical protein [Methanovulcanius yangii]
MTAASRDREYAVWVSPDELGTKKEITLDGKTVMFQVPSRIDGHVTLRLKGLGYTRDGETGNLLIQVNLIDEGSGGPGAGRRDWQEEIFQRTSPSSGGNPPGGGEYGGPGVKYRVFRSGGRGGMYGDIPPTPEPPIEDEKRYRRGGLMIAVGGLLISAASYAGLFPIQAYWGALVAIAGLALALHKK